jgi:hypothetical protein
MTTNKKTTPTQALNTEKLAEAATKFMAENTKPPRRSGGKRSKTVEQEVRPEKLPPVGTEYRRMFKGNEITVVVTAEGFEYNGEVFKSISACAKAIVGYGISGPVFFRYSQVGLEGE